MGCLSRIKLGSNMAFICTYCSSRQSLLGFISIFWRRLGRTFRLRSGSSFRGRGGTSRPGARSGTRPGTRPGPGSGTRRWLGLGLLGPWRARLGPGVGPGPGLAVAGPAPGPRAAPAAGPAATSISWAGRITGTQRGRGEYQQWFVGPSQTK